jgi:hypothetical protein
MSDEYRCLHNDDCKNIATCDELDGRNTSCDIHKLDETTYKKTTEFIKKAKEKHGDKYGYWNVVYINSRTKIIIFCKIHNILFQKVATVHLQKTIGCKECTNNKRIDTNIRIYGVENPSQLNLIKEKKIQTCMKNYGVKYSMMNRDIKKKSMETCIKKYGFNTPSKNEEIKEKIKQTCIKNYGVGCSFQNEEIKEKIKQTCIKKYGVEYSLQSLEIREKIRDTCVRNLGVNYPTQSHIVKEKCINTWINNLGVEHPSKSDTIKQQKIKTSQLHFGTDYPSQSPEIQEKTQKNAKKYKEYRTPSGNIWNVQGYEPYALDELFKTYTEDQIYIQRKDVPRIEYTVDGKKRYYFPDIFIPHENRIIEVKSTWTYKCKTDNIQLKKQSTIAHGYTYEIWVYCNKIRTSKSIKIIREICNKYDISCDENNSIEQLKEKLLEYHSNTTKLNDSDLDYIGNFVNN